MEDLTVHNPYSANCGHLYCYVCLKSKITLYEGEWACLRCGERVESMEKYAEIVEDEEVVDEKQDDGNEDSNKNELTSSGYIVGSDDLQD
ncbi:hypothetical protein BC943DRAFT_65230 [Umbelopsis sp. AD052]|nr:hypothetical protein BC943DRAFT_65230 [Umbelopsis sp. AD052]